LPPVMEMVQSGHHFDMLSPVRVTGEDVWVTLAKLIRAGSGRNRDLWIRLLNSLLDIGRARPIVVWHGSGTAGEPRLIYGTPSLLSYLAMEITKLAVGRDTFAVCFHCGHEYVPGQRAPKANQRNFCPDCRNFGASSKLAQRDRRARLRERNGW
jgi:hypothetical protein